MNSHCYKKNGWLNEAKKTISGKVIACDEENEQFPFRHLLEEMSYGCWSKLYEGGRVSIGAALEFLEAEYSELVIEMSEIEDARREKEDDYVHGPRWYWTYSTDLRLLAEIDDDLPAKLPRGSATAERWQWSEVDLLFALMAIDLAIDQLEKAEACSETKGGHVCCAATWALRASESFRLAMDWYPAHEQQNPGSTLCPSDMGKRGADVKHKRNRDARAKAIEIYNAKSWPSLAQAARTIAPQVSITEFVVLKWLRQHRQVTGIPKQ